MEIRRDFPEILMPLKDKITATIKPFIQIDATQDKNVSLSQSKFGGVPYWPKDQMLPRDNNDQYMLLLAQLNFAELPQLPNFPTKGILQFFIADDYQHGLNQDNLTNQDTFRVVYHAEQQPANQLINDFSFLPEVEEAPLFTPCSLSFKLSEASISLDDYQVLQRIWDIQKPAVAYGWPQAPDAITSELDAYRDYLQAANGHKLGGYPYFTQSDPRYDAQYLQENGWILLFQMDSDEKNDIDWGDCGVANFFIKEEDLCRKDFSNVIYNWDSH